MAHIFIFQRLNSWLVFSQHHKMSSKLTFFFHCNWAQDSYFLLNGSMLIRVALFLISHRGFPIKTIFTQSGSWRINANFKLIKSLERTLLKDYNLILQQEHDLCATKSRYNWAILGDRNTSFFHTSTIVRRRRNRIEKILDSSGNWVHEANEVADVVRKGFIKLFCTEKTSAIRNHWVLPRWSYVLSEEALSSLNHPISPMEIRDALWSIKPFKAPGPDSLHAGFYQNS